MRFYSKNGSTRKIIEAWREFCDHTYKPEWLDPAKLPDMNKESIELVSILLSEMGDYLDYHFEKGVLRKNTYHPQVWTDMEAEQAALRKVAVEVFAGNKPLRVKIEDAAQPAPLPLLPLSETAQQPGHPAAPGVLGQSR